MFMEWEWILAIGIILGIVSREVFNKLLSVKFIYFSIGFKEDEPKEIEHGHNKKQLKN